MKKVKFPIPKYSISEKNYEFFCKKVSFFCFAYIHLVLKREKEVLFSN